MLHPCLLLSPRTMEQLAPPAFNPHLKRVLKSYQSAAVGSLSGPSRYVAGWSDTAKLSPIDMEEYRKAVDNMEKTITESKQGTNVKFEGHYPPHVSASAFQQVQQMPLFIPMDSTRSEKSETILEGETIACFIVGGEKRLCLPQILNTVLRDFSLQQINAICDELHIFCSRCNPEQLEILKVTGILPLSAPSCGLVTKTDAERLCNALLHRSPEKSVDPPSPNSFKVYHECFGKCKGIFNPEMYSSPYAKCIECVDCHGVFSPQKFVCHSHKALENRTCHWGFDSANWRSYLLLSKDQEGKEKLQDVLDIMKARFDFMNRFKRKQSPDLEKDDGKRARYEDNKTPSATDYQNMVATLAENGQLRGMSAFRPWSPSLLNALKEGKGLGALQYRDGVTRGALPSFLHTGPPVLLNPERVIPHSDTNRYERHFAPNVSLAPASQQKVKVKEEPNNEEDGTGIRYLENSLDFDVSSDTESSSLKSDSVSSTPKDESENVGSSPSQETLSPEHEEQLTMLRKLLDGQVGDTKDQKDKFFEDFVKLQMRQEEKLRKMVEKRKMLQQELELMRVTMKDKLREAMEIKQSLRKEMESLVQDHRQQFKEVSESREQFKSELESLQSQKNCDIARAKAKYKGRLEQTRSQLQHCQQTNTLLKEQMAAVTAELKKYNHSMTDHQQTSPEKPCSPEATRKETENEGAADHHVSPQQRASPPETAQKTLASVEPVAALC